MTIAMRFLPRGEGRPPRCERRSGEAGGTAAGGARASGEPPRPEASAREG
jgi:hypothetical protein